VLPALKAAHIQSAQEQFVSDGAKKYGTMVSPMGWDMRGGELWIEPAAGSNEAPVRLCRYADVPMCVASYSKGGEWSGELVDVGRGTQDDDYDGKDVRGKVALAFGYAGQVVRQAVIQRGAVGAVIYPSATDRPSHPDMIRYNGVWPRASELPSTRAAFMVSASQYASLKQRMRGGPVVVRGRVDADLEPYKLTLVHAYIRGRDQPDEEVLVTAHLDHPKWSANDNASGSAAMLEVARTLATAIDAGKLPAPRRTLHFLWVPEFNGSVAYVWGHPEMRRCGPWDDPRPAPAKTKCIVANINMDMVGEDTVKTNPRFYFTRAPDSVPSFLTTLLTDVLGQTREAQLVAVTGTRNTWTPEVVRYTGGSDHDVFLGLGVPSTMLGHEPDWTHHTSEDTADKTDATELRRVGVFAAAAAQWMATAGDSDWKALTALAGADRAAEDARRAARQLVFAPELGAAAPLPTSFGVPGEPPATHGEATGPRRSTTLPIDASAFDDLAGDDKTWWVAQGKKYAGGSADAPDLDVLTYETVSFMDGHRSPQDIARLLSTEFLASIDAAWVERLVGILAARGLVTRG
jgi:peptidase M28-like protein